MTDTPVHYSDQNLTPWIVNFSGTVSSTIRSSFNILGTSLGLQSQGFDSDITNYAINDHSGDKIWYLSGHYTSTVKNSVSQSVTSFASISLSLFNAFVIGANLAGDGSEMVHYSGHITTTIKATFQTNNQSIYPGTNSPRCGFLVGPILNERPVFWVEPSSSDKRYIRLSSMFSSVIEDVEDGITIDTPLNVNVVQMASNGAWILFAGGSSPTQVHLVSYFGQTHVNMADILKPAFITNGGWDGHASDPWIESMFNTFSESLTSTIDFNGEAVFADTHTPIFPGDAIMSFGHEVIGGTWTGVNFLEFIPIVSRAGSTFNRSLSNNLGLEDAAGNTVTVSPDDGELVFNHTVALVILFSPSHTITFSGSATVESQNAVQVQGLEFSHEISLAGTIRNFSLSHDFNFGKQTAFWLTTVSDCTYDPQPPRSIEFPVVPQSFVRLADNLPVPVNTIDIRNPGLGNTEDIEIFRVFNTSRSRKYTAFRDPAWPINRTLKIISSENTQAESVTFLAFLEATAGEKIRLIDWEGRHWLGIITNPSTAVQDLGTCRYQFSIDFLGELTEPNIVGQTYNRFLEVSMNLGNLVAKTHLCLQDDFPTLPPLAVHCGQIDISPGFPAGDVP